MRDCISNVSVFCTHQIGLLISPRGCVLTLISICLVTAVSANGSAMAGDDPNALYDVVVQGILENCRKFDCGALTWQTEQKSRGIDDENFRRGEQGVHHMWWDGKKLATKATTWQIPRHGQEGERRREHRNIKVYDGNEYRSKTVGVPHITLAKQPRFNQSDYFFRYYYGWPGDKKSIVDRLADDMNNSQVSLEWSIVERDGTRQIKLKRSDKAYPNHYGTYYFDPMKGCMLVQDEYYKNNKLVYTATWTLQEVSQGMWFPVELNQHGQHGAIPKLNIQSQTYTTHMFVDLEQSAFNDRSAIPKGTFKLDITPDINLIIDHRLGEPPIMYDRTDAELLAMEELDKVTKEFLSEDYSGPTQELPEDDQLDVTANVMLNSVPNKPNDVSPDFLSQAVLENQKTGLLRWLLICAGIVLVTLGIVVGWRRMQHSHNN